MGEESTMPPPSSKKAAMTALAFGPQQRIVAHIEGDPAADPDRRHRLSGGRNALDRRFGARGSERRRGKRGARSHQHAPGASTRMRRLFRFLDQNRRLWSSFETQPR